MSYLWMLRQDIKWEMELWHRQEGVPKTPWNWVRAAWAHINWSIRYWMCERWGHKLEAIACDPENGSESLWCRRCGDSFDCYF